MYIYIFFFTVHIKECPCNRASHSTCNRALVPRQSCLFQISQLFHTSPFIDSKVSLHLCSVHLELFVLFCLWDFRLMSCSLNICPGLWWSRLCCSVPGLLYLFFIEFFFSLISLFYSQSFISCPVPCFWFKTVGFPGVTKCPHLFFSYVQFITSPLDFLLLTNFISVNPLCQILLSCNFLYNLLSENVGTYRM